MSTTDQFIKDKIYLELGDWILWYAVMDDRVEHGDCTIKF